MSRKGRSERKWALFAWQGVQIEVPDAWNLGAVTGNARGGHCRLDDDEVARVEVRWERGRSRMDVSGAAEAHIAQLARVAKKKKVPFNAKRDVKIAFPPDMEATCFEWRSDFHAFNLLAFCPTCKRTSLVRVMARSGERLRPVAARVFESFRDHAVDGIVPWAVYGFRCAVPERFRLDEHTLNLKRVELAFRDGAEQAAAARANLAEMQLRDRTLEAWLRENEREKLKHLSLQTQEETYRGHDALSFTGRTRLSKVKRLFGKGKALVGRVWHCEDLDKLFIVRWVGRDDGGEAFETFCASVVCHDEAAS